MLVNEPMDHAVCFIEARGNDVKVLGIAEL